MNIKQAKTFRIEDFLRRLGYQPVKRHKGCELRFFSPLRDERTPSFDVNTQMQVWNDLAMGQGGDLIDLACEYLRSHGRSGTISQALTLIEDTMGSAKHAQQRQPSSIPTAEYMSPEVQQKFDQAASKIQFLKAHSIKNSEIYRYLTSRGILSKDLIDSHVHEVHYHNLTNGKEYWAMGFPNMSNGYEVRSCSDGASKFKTSFNRDISYLEASALSRVGGGDKNHATAVNIFEGFIDYLSLAQMLQIIHPPNDTIVLNSLSSFKRAVNFIKTKKYDRIHLFLDYDDQGKKAVDRFTNGEKSKHGKKPNFDGFGESRVIDHSSAYGTLGYKDLNDALKAGYHKWPIR